MAEAVTGGDVKKLNKMMEMGQLDPNVHLPLLFDAMKKNAAPFMEQYFKTIQFWQGKAQKNQEDWVKKFLSSGGTSAITSFYKTWSQVIGDSVPMAERLGRIFKGIVHGFNAVMLMPGEISQWFSGTAGKGNFMAALFGDVDSSDIGSAIKRLVKEIGDAFKNEVGSMSDVVKNLTSLLVTMSNILAVGLQGIAEVVSLLTAFDKGGSDRVLWQMRTNANMRTAGELAASQVGPGATPADLAEAKRQNFEFLQASNPEPRGSTSMNPGQWGSDLATWSAGVDQSVQNMPGGRWNPLNWGRGYLGIGNTPPANEPATGASPMVMFHTFHVTQDPWQINAVVEARSDEQALQTGMDQALKKWQTTVYGGMLALSPEAPQ